MSPVQRPMDVGQLRNQRCAVPSGLSILIGASSSAFSSCRYSRFAEAFTLLSRTRGRYSRTNASSCMTSEPFFLFSPASDRPYRTTQKQTCGSSSWKGVLTILALTAWNV